MPDYEPVQPGELDLYHGPRRGVVAVRDVIRLLEGKRVGAMGIYNRRPVRGGDGTVWSLHAVGRALDVHVSTRDDLWRIACTAVRACHALGVCEVIAEDARWSGGVWEEYDGPRHDDHVHIGFTRRFADATADTKAARALVAFAWTQARR